MSFRSLAVVIAVKNGNETIGACIESLAPIISGGAQIYIYDSKSEDGTRESALSRHPDAIYIYKQDDGLYDAWNRAIRQVSEPLIFFINCDDTLYSSENFSILIRILEDNELLVAASGKTVMSRMDGKIRFSGEPLKRNWFVGDMPLITPATVFSVAALRSIHGFNMAYRISADYDMVLRLLRKYRWQAFYFSDIAITNFSLSGMSNKYRKQAFKEIRKIVKSNIGLAGLFLHSLSVVWIDIKRLLLRIYFKALGK